jgi:NAD(P)-dependent dehydrogenase (short-subunit alcohol dehydrogenase family)
MSQPNRFIIILGSGPGIGVGVASYFASKGFNRVALLSRNAERLQVDAESVHSTVKEAGAPEVTLKTYPVDLADSPALAKVLETVEKELGVPEVVVYNASLVSGSRFFQIGEEDVEKGLKVTSKFSF